MRVDDTLEILLMIGANLVRLSAFVIAATSLLGSEALAVQSFIHVPGIAGEESTPGYPGVMTVESLTITPTNLTVIKAIDSASPAIFTAAALGTNLGTVETLLYNDAPAGPPDALLPFFDTLVSSYQGNVTTEEITFAADNPLELYLEVPGIPGVSDTPGHPSVMRINSFTLTGSEFTIIKAEDAASDDLFLATANGVFFNEARLLLYDALPPGSEPDAVVEFQDLLITSMQSLPNRLEQVTFSFDTLSQPVVPEPSTAALALGGLAIMGAWRRQR